jgi:hypothetical protein
MLDKKAIFVAAAFSARGCHAGDAQPQRAGRLRDGFGARQICLRDRLGRETLAALVAAHGRAEVLVGDLAKGDAVRAVDASWQVHPPWTGP